MANANTDFDFDFSDPQQDPQAGTFDDIFADVNFGEAVDPEFEARLAADYPVQEDPVQEEPAPTQPEAHILPEPNDETSLQQQQFVNPQDIFGAPLPGYAPEDLNGTFDLGINWPFGQAHLDMVLAQDLEKTLAEDPLFNPLQLHTETYSNYFPMSNQRNEPIILQQPGANHQINGQQMLLQQPVDLGYQVSWPLQHEQVTQYIPQANLQPIPEQMPLPMPPSMPILTQPGVPPAMPQPRLPGMPPPPNQQVYHPMPSRPIPTGPLPPVEHKPVDPTTNSFIPVHLRSSRNSRELPSAGTQTTSPPLRRPARNHNGEALLNERIPRKTHRGKGPGMVEPERYYGPSPPKPRDWGPKDARGRSLFTYTEKGELAAGLYLTARQMRQYLLGPSPKDRAAGFEGPFKLPGVKLRTKKMRQGLTLWIGWPPAMSNTRYPRSGESSKCRFKNCPYRLHTISLGDPWVILDERQNVDGEAVDPFHNAGYLHLFCLERNFDIVDLWQYLDIRPDYRSFKRESHPYFCLAYKLPGIDAVVKEWWHTAFRNWEIARSRGLKRVRTHESSLTQSLVEHKLDNESKSSMKSRQKRGGIDISRHRGNPEVRLKLEAFRKYGLLDDQGCPVPDADEILDDIENPNRRDKMNTHSSVMAAAPHPSSVSAPNYDYQYPYPHQQTGMKSMDTGTLPVYNPNLVYPNPHPIPPNPPILANPYSLPAPSPSRSKRSWDEVVLEDWTLPQMHIPAAAEPLPPIQQETSSPKRQRLTDSTPAYNRLVTEPTLPTLPSAENLPGLSVPNGDAAMPTQGYLETNIIATWDPPIDYKMDVDYLSLDHKLGNDVLDSFFDNPVANAAPDNDKMIGNIDNQVGNDAAQAGPALAQPTLAQPEPAPTPHEARANQSDSDGDSFGGLFGRPGSSTPSTPSGSPTRRRCLSPLEMCSPNSSQ